MIRSPSYFFCGVGGSGMLPLARIVQARGATVAGSDRGRDQGRTPDKFAWIERQGIRLFPQDGSGLTSPDQTLVASAAVEDTVPDVAAAARLGCARITRAELLASLFNAADTRIGVAGTSGKSTVTAMIAQILHAAGRAPTVMNGADMLGFATADEPYASALIGGSETFASEVDESDGSIALYRPTVAVVTNIALDHKSMEDLRALFADFAGRAETAVLSADNADTLALAGVLANGPVEVRTFGIETDADLWGEALTPLPDGVAFTVREATGDPIRVRLRVPGRHNVANALAALAACRAVNMPLVPAAEAIGAFAGVRRRLQTIGTASGVTVIDDFAHNPDKIAATLATLHETPGRLLVMWQPHGYGPLRLMKDALADAFRENLAADDRLLMPEPAYFGGTVDRSVGSGDLAEAIGAPARALADRAACGEQLLATAQPGDRIVVMGARDDSLTDFARALLEQLVR